MATPEASGHLPPVVIHPRQEVGHQLQAMLVEFLDLSLLAEQLHWTPVGPLTRPSICSWTSYRRVARA